MAFAELGMPGHLGPLVEERRAPRAPQKFGNREPVRATPTHVHELAVADLAAGAAPVPWPKLSDR
eukprot:8472849-Alexandrium_andersonii.AAC.1